MNLSKKMSRKIISFLVVIITFSCKEGDKSIPKKTNDAAKALKNKELSVYTKYKYPNPEGGEIIIQNSFPRGGMKYAAPDGKKYIYAVFWTRIINKTANAFELKISIPVNSYEIPSLPGQYFKIVIPSDEMTLDKISKFNYGLENIESFLDTNISKPSSLKRTIAPKQSTGFYVVMLCVAEGAKGTLRTELYLKEQNLFYRINGKEISCGSIIK